MPDPFHSPYDALIESITRDMYMVEFFGTRLTLVCDDNGNPTEIVRTWIDMEAKELYEKAQEHLTMLMIENRKMCLNPRHLPMLPEVKP